MPAASLTAEEFAATRYELPDGGRWSELAGGVVVTLDPPDLAHGTAVMNLSKAFAEFAAHDDGYACFELGVVVKRKPDSVWFPAVSWFSGGPRFAESDKQVTETVPALVVEVASTNSRRRDLRERIVVWHDRGVQAVWVIDPSDKRVHVLAARRPPQNLAAGDMLRGGSVLEGFAMEVERVFAEPTWWK